MTFPRIQHSHARLCAIGKGCSRDKPKTLAVRARNSMNRFLAQVRSLFSRKLKVLEPETGLVARRSCTASERARFLKSELMRETAVASFIQCASLPEPPAGLSLAEAQAFKESQFAFREQQVNEILRNVQNLKVSLSALTTG